MVGDGVEPRPRRHLRRPRAAVDPGLHARHVAQARPQVERGRAEVLPDGRVRHGGDALRHVADLRRRPARRTWRPSAPRSPPASRAGRHPRASCSSSSASPSRCRRCRSTPGRPTPTRARRRRSPRSCRWRRRRPASSPSRRCASSGFWPQEEVWQPLFWVLAVASMTVGNLVALRQTNIVRLFAYSSIAQGGYILAPLAVAGESRRGPRGVDRRARRSTCSSTAP